MKIKFLFFFKKLKLKDNSGLNIKINFQKMNNYSRFEMKPVYFLFVKKINKFHFYLDTGNSIINFNKPIKFMGRFGVIHQYKIDKKNYLLNNFSLGILPFESKACFFNYNLLVKNNDNVKVNMEMDYWFHKKNTNLKFYFDLVDLINTYFINHKNTKITDSDQINDPPFALCMQNLRRRRASYFGPRLNPMVSNLGQAREVQYSEQLDSIQTGPDSQEPLDSIQTGPVESRQPILNNNFGQQMADTGYNESVSSNDLVSNKSIYLENKKLKKTDADIKVKRIVFNLDTFVEKENNKGNYKPLVKSKLLNKVEVYCNNLSKKSEKIDTCNNKLQLKKLLLRGSVCIVLLRTNHYLNKYNKKDLANLCNSLNTNFIIFVAGDMLLSTYFKPVVGDFLELKSKIELNLVETELNILRAEQKSEEIITTVTQALSDPKSPLKMISNFQNYTKSNFIEIIFNIIITIAITKIVVEIRIQTGNVSIQLFQKIMLITLDYLKAFIKTKFINEDGDSNINILNRNKNPKPLSPNNFSEEFPPNNNEVNRFDLFTVSMKVYSQMGEQMPLHIPIKLPTVPKPKKNGIVIYKTSKGTLYKFN